MGYTVDDYILQHSVATMAHTDTYTLPKARSTSATMPQNNPKNGKKSTSQVLSESWEWYSGYKDNFCEKDKKKLVQSHLAESKKDQDHWLSFLNCILAMSNHTDERHKNTFLRNIICNEHEDSVSS